MTHPDTYTLTRKEWLLINRTLAGAALELALPGAADARVKRRERLASVREAQDTLSASYKRAALAEA